SDLTCRYVHAHGQIAAEPSPPARGLPARLLEHPAPDLDDLTGLLGEPDEVGRLEQAARRMLPANECLDANDAPALELDDGLVVEDELVLDAGSAQIRDELEAPDEVVVHLRGIDHVLRLA